MAKKTLRPGGLKLGVKFGESFFLDLNGTRVEVLVDIRTENWGEVLVFAPREVLVHRDPEKLEGMKAAKAIRESV